MKQSEKSFGAMVDTSDSNGAAPPKNLLVVLRDKGDPSEVSCLFRHVCLRDT